MVDHVKSTTSSPYTIVQPANQYIVELHVPPQISEKKNTQLYKHINFKFKWLKQHSLGLILNIFTLTFIIIKSVYMLFWFRIGTKQVSQHALGLGKFLILHKVSTGYPRKPSVEFK